MENAFTPYECQFSIKERKQIVAQVLRELRMAYKYSQKEVAELLGLSQPGYNGYETGRTEPPLEILVRLAYLYKVPVDLIVQKDRLYRDVADIKQQMEQLNAEVLRLESEVSGNEMAEKMIDAMKALTEGMQKYSSQPSIKEQIEASLDKPEK